MTTDLDDALVDTFRALRALRAFNDADRAQPANPVAVVRGAGRDCKPNRCVPSKRIRSWHRAADVSVSLKQYARKLATTSGDNKQAALDWLRGKSVRP